MGSRNVSHRWTAAFGDHLLHRFVVLKDVQQITVERSFCVEIDSISRKHLSSNVCVFPPLSDFWDASHTENESQVSPCRWELVVSAKYQELNAICQ